MENQHEAPRRERSGPRGRLRTRRVVLASVAGCAVPGGVLVLLRWERPGPPAPPSPGAPAMAAVTAGVPAALPDLAELIDESMDASVLGGVASQRASLTRAGGT